jgi:antitoxin (DNA-binding transcriptional repressor) of toxin-antitoxin stability system
MKVVGIHELKEHISEILHELQEKRETIEVTDHGQVVALLNTGA